jgi:hypothetical protein
MYGVYIRFWPTLRISVIIGIIRYGIYARITQGGGKRIYVLYLPYQKSIGIICRINAVFITI